MSEWPDSLPTPQALAPKLAPLAASLDSIVPLLRADSGSVRADSVFTQFRDAFHVSVRAAVRTFDGPELQRTMAPHIANRDYGKGTAPPAVDEAVADSMIRFLNAYGIRSYQAEGMAYFNRDDEVLLRRFGSFVTEPMREFLRLEVLEQAKPVVGGGSIAVTWDRISERLAATDRLLTEHPDVVTHGQLADNYRRFLGLYLAGDDNRSTFPRRTRILHPEVWQSYDRYLTEHASTRSAQVVREYLALLATTGYRPLPPVVSFIKERTGFVIGPAR